jgi:flavodoxin
MAPTSNPQRLTSSHSSVSLRRRQLLSLALVGSAGTFAAAALGSCGQQPQPEAERGRTQEGESPSPQSSSAPTNAAAPKVLVAYFSRAAENYYNGDRTWLKVGNTELVARMIADLIPCDLHRIEAADRYSDDYDETVARNVGEQNADARPAIANPLPAIDQYDVVLLGSPIWNVRAPMTMSTFTENHDFTGKTVHPFTTYAMSGLGTTERDYARSCAGAAVADGLAIRGEEAQQARPQIAEWLRRIGLQ